MSQVHWPFTDKNTKELEPPYKGTWQAMEELVELVRSCLTLLKQFCCAWTNVHVCAFKLVTRHVDTTHICHNS